MDTDDNEPTYVQEAWDDLDQLLFECAYLDWLVS